MATIAAYQYVITTVNGKRYEFGSLTSPSSITAAQNDAMSLQFTIGTDTEQTLWDASTASLSDFDFMMLVCDLDLWVELESAATARYNVMTLAGSGTAGTWGPPLIIGSDACLTGVGAMSASLANTGVLEKIKVHNASATATAEALLLLFT